MKFMSPNVTAKQLERGSCQACASSHKAYLEARDGFGISCLVSGGFVFGEVDACFGEVLQLHHFYNLGPLLAEP